jgi:hypothetical protein
MKFTLQNFLPILIFVTRKWEANGCLLCGQTKLTKWSFDLSKNFHPFPLESVSASIQLDRMRRKSSDKDQVTLIEGSPTYWMKDIVLQPHLLNQQQTYQINEEQQLHNLVRLMEINPADDSDSATDSRNKIRDVFISIIYWYKNSVSPLMQPNCRFLPTCSTYAIESMNLYGPYRLVGSIILFISTYFLLALMLSLFILLTINLHCLGVSL